MSKQPKTKPSALVIIGIILSVISAGITAVALVIVIKIAQTSRVSNGIEYPTYQDQQPESGNAEENSTTQSNEDPKPDNTPQYNPSKVISESEAKKIALSRAGLAENQVRFTKVEYEVKLRYAKYEIEFYSNAVEYEIDIDAETGEVIKYDVERAR